ncbi:MAG: PTS sugar transporter subunit IIB, partial [Bombilactobacillus sp.]|nr:PTS sugar transporter subunit IIB [Bombilactobacillus sp.]
VDNAIELLNDERSKQMRLLVITTTVKDALTIADGVNEKPEQVNIGNAGKMGAKGDEITLTKEVRLSPDEINYLRKLVEEYQDTYFQGTPNMEKHSGKEVLQKIDK